MRVLVRPLGSDIYSVLFGAAPLKFEVLPDVVARQSRETGEVQTANCDCPLKGHRVARISLYRDRLRVACRASGVSHVVGIERFDIGSGMNVQSIARRKRCNALLNG